jgi:hypothetical protein
MEALLGLGGVVIGGALVMLTDLVRYRRDLRERRLDQLRLAVSDVLATYLDTRAKVIAVTEAGASFDRPSMFPSERQIAVARLFTLPGSEVLDDDIDRLGRVTVGMIDAEDAVARESAYNEQLELIRSIEAAVRRFG